MLRAAHLCRVLAIAQTILTESECLQPLRADLLMFAEPSLSRRAYSDSTLSAPETTASAKRLGKSSRPASSSLSCASVKTCSISAAASSSAPRTESSFAVLACCIDTSPNCCFCALASELSCCARASVSVARCTTAVRRLRHSFCSSSVSRSNRTFEPSLTRSSNASRSSPSLSG